MDKVVTFGEIMMRIQPPDYYRFVQVDSMTTTFGGAEANVAVSLANFGLDSYYVTKLPAHEIGQSALHALRRYGVRTDYIVHKFVTHHNISINDCHILSLQTTFCKPK